MDLKEPTIIENFYKARKPRVYKKTSPTLRSDRLGLIVSTQTNGTNTPPKSTRNTMESATQGTLLPFQQQTFQTTIYSLADSLVRHFQSQGKEQGSMTLEELYFLKSLGLPKTINLCSCCWRTSKDLSPITEVKP